MFGFWSKPLSGPLFEIGKQSVFSKKQLTPKEFGLDITRLSFDTGISTLEGFQTSSGNGLEDARLLSEIANNPGLMQLLMTNLTIGGYLSFVKFVLKVPEETIDGMVHRHIHCEFSLAQAHV